MIGADTSPERNNRHRYQRGQKCVPLIKRDSIDLLFYFAGYFQLLNSHNVVPEDLAACRNQAR